MKLLEKILVATNIGKDTDQTIQEEIGDLRDHLKKALFLPPGMEGSREHREATTRLIDAIEQNSKRST